MKPSGPSGIKVAIVSLHAVERVSRLRRFVTALRDEGVETWLIAGREREEIADELVASPNDRLGDAILFPIEVTPAQRLRYRLMRTLRGVCARAPGSAWRVFEKSEPESHSIEGGLSKHEAERSRNSRPFEFDVVLGHGLGAMPLAQALSRKSSAKLIYDATELFTEQYSYSRLWRTFERPFIIKQERYYARSCDAIISPCPAYLDHVRRIHDARPPSAVVRNTMEVTAPEPAARSALAPGKPLTFIYQGLALPNRGIETYIESAASWPADTRLILQLVGTDDYILRLRSLVASRGLSGKVDIIPPAPATATALIASIAENQTAVGLCCFDPEQLQVRLSEPNKLHTYLAAGVAVIAVSGTAVGNIVSEHGLGRTIPAFAPDRLAEAVASLERERNEIAACGDRALDLARSWSWQAEKHRLADLILRMSRGGC